MKIYKKNDLWIVNSVIERLLNTFRKIWVCETTLLSINFMKSKHILNV